jgi:hypothetical protein
MSKTILFLNIALIAQLGCGDNDPTDPNNFTSPSGEVLAFGVKEGNIRNYFHRQGPAAVHLLTRSGAEPRLIAAFPANNQGIGLWFLSSQPGEDTQLWAGSDPNNAATGGGLKAVVREDSQRDMNGVRAMIHSDASKLTAYLPLLANVRTLRDFGYGLCLENVGQFPELRNETIDQPTSDTVRIRREQIGGGGYAMEILLKAGEGTKLLIRQEEIPARAKCLEGAGSGQVVEISGSGSGGVSFEVVAMSNDEPLTPIEKARLLTTQPPDSFELNALAFLSYQEKLQAGSWRFLTYFGRDTLLSVRMLMPGLRREVVEAALTAVMDRINLREGVPDPYFDYTIEVGDVSHEEELGDYAAWNNGKQAVKPADLRQPRYDYKMVDDDFLLAPVVAEYIEKVTKDSPTEAAGIIDAFLARQRPDGTTFKAALEANLKLVLDRARPFADDPATPVNKKTKLVSLKNTVPVGQWRDSDLGIAFGRYAFDVNAGLVPGALEAAVALYTRLGDTAKSADAMRMLTAWSNIEELFAISETVMVAQSNVTTYAAEVKVTNTASQIVATDQGGRYVTYGISLNQAGVPLPVMHTDHGFVMEFAKPTDPYLFRVASAISADYPAGLMSKVGVLVANPATAPADFTVTDPKNLKDPSDDVQNVRIREIFKNSHYHGAVVWSWQQALLASGMRRQLERTDISAATRAELQKAECKLWNTIDAAQQVRAGELWSWAPNDSGQLEYRAFGYNLADVDESNAAQLWSTVYLVVKRPTTGQNTMCGM